MELIDIQERIEGFIRSNFGVPDHDPRFDRTVDLYAGGYIDSVGVVELLEFVRTEFGVEVPESDLLDSDFSTVDGVGRIVSRHL
jgi:acyl carrier protein